MYLSDLAKILSLAAVLNRVSKDESRNSLIALAWTLRNQEKMSEKLPKSMNPASNILRDSSAGKVSSARSWNIFTLFKPGLDDGYCRSLAIASLVWCGDEADPTAGSTRFHRHDDWPDWARNSQPAALIGSWFFYNQIDMPR